MAEAHTSIVLMINRIIFWIMIMLEGNHTVFTTCVTASSNWDQSKSKPF